MTTPSNFADRLQDAVDRTESALVLGIDPHLELLPEEYAVARDVGAPREERADAIARFACRLVDLAAGSVPAIKPQSAFFELFGADGVRAWERVVAHARAAGLLVIGDVKRGDIASTAAAYARAFLEGPDGDRPAHVCDAVTVNAFLGEDSLRPFLEVAARNGAGLFVLVRTSNPGSADFQLHGQPTLSDLLAQAVDRWGAELVGGRGLSSVGAVVGATHPAELCRLRDELPRTPFLVPGFGAQGAGPEEIAGAFLAGGRGALVASSRGIAFAHAKGTHAGKPWEVAAQLALTEAVAAIRRAASLGAR